MPGLVGANCYRPGPVYVAETNAPFVQSPDPVGTYIVLGLDLPFHLPARVTAVIQVAIMVVKVGGGLGDRIRLYDNGTQIAPNGLTDSFWDTAQPAAFNSTGQKQVAFQYVTVLEAGGHQMQIRADPYISTVAATWATRSLVVRTYLDT